MAQKEYIMTTQNPFSFMQDFFKTVSDTTVDYFKALPKNPDEAKALFEKVQAVFKAECENTQDMWKIYQKAATGDATVNEITTANRNATELLKSTAFASIIAIPGSVFVLPMLIAKAKEYNVDLVPKSVSEHFGI